MDLADLVEEISGLGLVDALQKYYNKALHYQVLYLAQDIYQIL
jgi:hypothetical protein